MFSMPLWQKTVGRSTPTCTSGTGRAFDSSISKTRGGLMARMVKCVKLGRELPGLDRPPFPGELGKRIFENVSKDAWAMWREQSVLLINHYGLNMVDPNAQTFLMEQMEQFFFGEEAKMPEGWTPEGQGGKSAEGVPQQKK